MKCFGICTLKPIHLCTPLLNKWWTIFTFVPGTNIPTTAAPILNTMPHSWENVWAEIPHLIVLCINWSTTGIQRQLSLEWPHQWGCKGTLLIVIPECSWRTSRWHKSVARSKGIGRIQCRLFLFVGNQPWLEQTLCLVWILSKTMKDMGILCYILFLDWYGIFLGLHDRGNAYVYGG
jgi:hypothetical protein